MLIYIYIYKIAISDNAFILAKGRFLFLFFIKRKKKKIGAEIKTVEKLSLREEWNLYLDEENLRRT